MNFQPGSRAPVDRFIQGTVTAVSQAGTGTSSPSIHRFDGAVDVDVTSDTTLSGTERTVRIVYDRQSYVIFDQVGRSFLFAIAGEHCVGALPLDGARVVLPDSTQEDAVAYIQNHLNRPFPDYFGFTSEIVT